MYILAVQMGFFISFLVLTYISDCWIFQVFDYLMKKERGVTTYPFVSKLRTGTHSIIEHQTKPSHKSVFREMTAWDGFPLEQLTCNQKAGNKIKPVSTWAMSKISIKEENTACHSKLECSDRPFSLTFLHLPHVSVL